MSLLQMQSLCLSNSSLLDFQYLKVRPQQLGCPSLALHPFELYEMDQKHTFEVKTHGIHYEGLKVTTVKQFGRPLLVLSW